MRVKLSQIYIGRRARKDYGKSELPELMKDMEENGQITAITVRPPNIDEEGEDDYEGQPWVLVAGGRRLMAASMLGWEDIEAYAREEMSELVARTLELHENLKRKAMTWQEEVASKAEIAQLRRAERPDITDAEIAKELGESPATFSRDVQTAKLIEANPQLAKSTSKNQALNTGKILENYRQQNTRLQNTSAMTFEAIRSNIHEADAESFVLNLDEKSVDLFLCDGPYGIDYWSMAKVSSPTEGGEKHLAHYDDSPSKIFPMYERLLPDMVRAARDTGWIVFFCSTQLERHLRACAARCCRVHAAYQTEDGTVGGFRCDEHVTGGPKCEPLAPEEIPWIWYKPNASSSSRFPHLHASNRYELILPINMGKATLARPGCGNVLDYEVNYGKEDRIHGVQRPIEVLQDLVERLSYPGDLVVDLFYGSGSTLAAAASKGRRFMGCDSNPSLREFAIGLVTKHYKPIADSTLEEAAKRRERMEAGESPAPLPMRPADGDFDYELMRVGTFHLGYIKYAGHTVGQLKGGDEALLEGQLMDAVDQLRSLAGLGIIDPRTATTEEIMGALKGAST